MQTLAESASTPSQSLGAKSLIIRAVNANDRCTRCIAAIRQLGLARATRCYDEKWLSPYDLSSMRNREIGIIRPFRTLARNHLWNGRAEGVLGCSGTSE